jgi:hypothetical protein
MIDSTAAEHFPRASRAARRPFIVVERTLRLRESTSESDAVDGSSTGPSVP